MVADRTDGIASVMTRMPPGRTVRRMSLDPTVSWNTVSVGKLRLGGASSVPGGPGRSPTSACLGRSPASEYGAAPAAGAGIGD